MEIWTYPKIVPPINIPLYIVSWAFWEIGVESMRFTDFGSLGIRLFFMFLIVTMVWIDLGICSVVNMS